MVFEWFIDKGLVAVLGAITARGEDKVGDLSGLTTIEQIKKKVDEAFPESSSLRKGVLADTLHKFRNEMQVGDLVLTYSRSERVYAMGKITSEYIFDPSMDMQHIRQTDYSQRTISRNNLTYSTKRALMAGYVLYLVQSEAKREIFQLQRHATTEKSFEPPQEPETDNESKLEDQLDFQYLSDISGEFIKDKIVSLEWHEMEKLVAGLLRAMGYKTRRTPQGPDGGIDIVASKDALGFEKPTIAVEVKHKQSRIHVQNIRSFLSVCRSFDGGLFVSTGGFTKDARQLAQNSDESITIMDSDMLLNYLLEHYDKLDDETHTLLPLGKLYWPKE